MKRKQLKPSLTFSHLMTLGQETKQVVYDMQLTSLHEGIIWGEGCPRETWAF